MAWTAPRTWVASEIVTSALLNTHLRDNQNWIGRVGINGWAVYAPTWTSTGTNPAIGNGTLAGTYAQIGRLTIARFRMVAGSTSTYGTGNYQWALPVVTDSVASSSMLGVARIDDSGTQYVVGLSRSGSAVCVGTVDAAGFVSNTSPMTWANGNEIDGLLVYAAAT